MWSASGCSSSFCGWYGSRLRDQAGLSPPSPSPSCGGPPVRRVSDKRRSNSAHGIGGLFQPIGHSRPRGSAVFSVIAFSVIAFSVIAGLRRPFVAVEYEQPGRPFCVDHLEALDAAVLVRIPPPFEDGPWPCPRADIACVADGPCCREECHLRRDRAAFVDLY